MSVRRKDKVVIVYDGIVRTQYVIMNILKSNKATNYMKSMTLEEIQEIEGRNKPNTLYKHIRILQKKNLVETGAKVERANGYFLNEAGLELLKKFDDMEENEI